AGLALGRDPFDGSTEEDERIVLETNVNGLIRMTRLCLPHVRDGGHIVNIGSIAGRQAYPEGSLYVTSKFAVRGFTYALREDPLFLSRFSLRINGERPLLLSSDKIEYFSAAFFMRNPLAGGLEADALSIRRERFVGDGMQDTFVIENQGMQPVEFELTLDIGCDFADIFAVKEFDFALGDPLGAEPLPATRPGEFDRERNQFLLSDDGDMPLKTQV